MILQVHEERFNEDEVWVEEHIKTESYTIRRYFHLHYLDRVTKKRYWHLLSVGEGRDAYPDLHQR